MAAPERGAAAANPLEALAVIAICFGWFIAVSISTVAAGFPPGSATFDDSSLIELIAIELVLGALALALLRARGHSIARLLPTPTWRGCLAGAGILFVAMAVWTLIAGLFPADELARQPIAVETASRKAVSVSLVIALSMVNGLYEETFLAGYLIRQLRSAGPSLAIGISVLVRVLYHLYQGPLGAVSVLVFGLVVSAFYWRSGRLWPIVFAHTLADAIAFS